MVESGGEQARPGLRCRVQARAAAESASSGSTAGATEWMSDGKSEQEPDSPLTPWGSVFAVWGLEETAEKGEEGNPDVVIHAVMTFEEAPPSHDSVLELVNNKLLCHKRFCKRIRVNERGQPVWVTCQVDAEKHVTAVEMAGPPKGGDQLAQGTELLAHVEQDMAHSMPDDRPPWQVYIVSYSDGSPGGALHWKIHHAIGDGISLASLLLGCVDGGVPEVPGESSSRAAAPRSLPIRMLDRVTNACGLVCNTAVALARATWLLFVPDLPSAVRAQGVLYRKRAPRHIALSPQISLAEVKAIGRAAGAATVNDVVMSAVAAGLARYELRRGAPPGGQRLTASMVVNIRPIKGIKADIASSEAGADTHWGNRIGPIFTPMVLFGSGGAAIHPRKRLNKMHSFLAPKKNSMEPILLGQIIRLAGNLIGTGMAYRLINRLGRTTSIVVSNVPGPQEPLSIGGRVVSGMFNTANGSPLGARWGAGLLNSAHRTAMLIPLHVALSLTNSV